MIAASLRSKGAEQQQEKRVRVPELVEYLTDVGSETSVGTSPDLGEVGGEPIQEVAASPHPKEVGSKPDQEVIRGPLGSRSSLEVTITTDIEDEEEEEDKNRDAHFKLKHKSPPQVTSPRKKRKQTVNPSSRY